MSLRKWKVIRRNHLAARSKPSHLATRSSNVRLDAISHRRE
jgi:hypothetical protein